jgi:hypothetical protein
LVKTEERAEFAGIAVKLGDFLLRVGLMFDDFAWRVFEEFVYPVKAPIDCDWRAFLNCSSMLPFCAGLLDGKSCFARSIEGFGGAASLTARPNMTSAIEEYRKLEIGALKADN